MATIVQTRLGKWKAVVRKRGWPTVSKTFRIQKDALTWAKRTEVEIEKGIFIDPAHSERITFDKALTRYLSEVVPTKKPATQETDKYCAEPLRAYFGKYSLAAISPDLVAGYRDKRLATPIQRIDRTTKKPRVLLDPLTGEPRTLSANTVRLELALLSHLFNTAIREWRLGLVRNPVSGIRKPSPGVGRDRRLRGNEETRLKHALASYSNPMLGWIFDIALETGMRSGEIAGLRLHQVDVQRRVVRLTVTKNESARTVPLTRRAVEVFALALDNPTRPEGCDLVFFGEPGRDGKRRPYTFAKVWNGIKTSLGLGDLHFHDLRHEAVSRLVEAGFSDQEVSAISGHKSMQMLKRYTHLRAEDLVDRLDAIAKPNKSSA